MITTICYLIYCINVMHIIIKEYHYNIVIYKLIVYIHTGFNILLVYQLHVNNLTDWI